jgi:GTP-binding protein Era
MVLDPCKDVNGEKILLKEGPSGFVALVGKPNVGKSTLMNALLGEKVVIVTPKPQTTRNRVLGIYTSDEGQIVFLDTPGIHKPMHRLNEYMVGVAQKTVKAVDVVALLIDGVRGIIHEDQLAIKQVFSGERGKPVIGVVNKIDLMKGIQVEERVSELKAQGSFIKVLALSALTGEGVKGFMDALLSLLPHGPYLYPPDMVTDQSMEFLIAEAIREKVFFFTHEEIPYSTAVVVEEIREKRDLLVIRTVIYVERASQKGILIGRKGQMLKLIGEKARTELEGLLGTKIYLDLWVKVKEKWRKKEGALRELGYYQGKGM